MGFHLTARGRLIPSFVLRAPGGSQRGDSGTDSWIKSTFSGTGDCVEWSIDPTKVRVRDSKNPAGPVLTFTHSEWEAFRRGIQAGEAAL